MRVQAMQSTTQSAHDEYVFPRDTRGPPKVGPSQGPSNADVDVMLREQAERTRLLQELVPQVSAPPHRDRHARAKLEVGRASAGGVGRPEDEAT
jgi:hypothetical protein